MVDLVLPRSLPTTGSVAADAAFIMDNGSGVFQVTAAQIVAAAPIPSLIYTTLGAFKAAPIANKAQTLQAPSIAVGSFNWETANAPYTADDVNVIKADSTALSVGAWVRQGAGAIQHVQPGTGAVRTTVAASVAALGITPNDFGLTFDGSDETAKLQAMINAGATYKVPIFLYGGGTTYITSSLDCRGKFVDIRGVSAEKTSIAAAAAMASVFNFSESADGGFSPYFLSNLKIDGGGFAQVGVLTRYRRGSVISGCSLTACTQAALREKDAVAVTRENTEFAGSPISVDLQGANNSSKFSRCTMSGATDTHVKIGNTGGNFGLLFSACDIEFGAGKGVTVASGTSVTFDTCYIGEEIGGAVFENSGHTRVVGGYINWGFTSSSSLMRPLAGRLMIAGAQIGAMSSGDMSNLFGLTNAEVDAGNYGKGSIRDSIVGMGTTSLPINGDVLDYIPSGRNFVPLFGQDWVAASFDGTVTSVASNGSRTMTVTAPGGSNANVLRAPLGTGWQRGKPIYIAIVAKSTKAINVRLAESAFGAAYDCGAIAAKTRDTTTLYISLTPTAATAYPYMELQLASAAINDTLTLHKVVVSDYPLLSPSTGQVGNVGLIA